MHFATIASLPLLARLLALLVPASYYSALALPIPSSSNSNIPPRILSINAALNRPLDAVNVAAAAVVSPVASAGSSAGAVEQFRQVDETTLGQAQKTHASLQRALEMDDTGFEVLDIGQTYKVVQIADMHLSTFQNGKICHSPKPGHEEDCSDDSTLEFINRLLDKEQPDLVVFSGDNINGETTSDAASLIKRYSDTCIKRKINWIHIWGNHDDEKNLSPLVPPSKDTKGTAAAAAGTAVEGPTTTNFNAKDEYGIFADRLDLFELGRGLPYSLTHKGPKGVNGVGNGHLTLRRKGKIVGRVWYLDSGNYISGGRYGYLHRDQVDWFTNEAQHLPPSPVDITFFHIPTNDWNRVEAQVGEKNEPVMEQGKASGILSAMEKRVGLQVATTGHDHTNDYCGLNGRVNLCYGGGIGYGRAYGSVPPAPYFSKRARVFRLSVVSETETRLETWKRLDDDALTVVDVQTLGIGSSTKLKVKTKPAEEPVLAHQGF
ncbi:purple acid phosphatase [Geranomyces variabilis]|uniref:Purple acid phosphatase n=1 Tax=Geranomyces variabilis TaxID=109894 RepID=A0AAD5TGM8_9FUNG|nr:purple acid phosphatase [Geranomyces variabilis]